MNLIQIYKSPRKDEMYLYVDRQEDLKRVPEALLAQFGAPEKVMLLPLTAEKKLARANAGQVLEEIREKGYFLQMPPAHRDAGDELARKIAEFAAKFDQDEER